MTAERKRNVTFSIGAPSLTAIDANDVVANEFNSGDFPLSVKVVNRAMFEIILPGKFHLKPFHDINCIASVEIKSQSEMHRLVSDLESIAENHKKAKLVEIEVDVIDSSLLDEPPIIDAPPVDAITGDIPPDGQPIIDAPPVDAPPVEKLTPSRKTKGG